MSNDHDEDDDDEFLFNIKKKYNIEGKRIGGYVISKIPEKDRTLSICVECILRHGGALEFVPMHLRTKSLCMLALKTFPSCLEYVPDEHKTYEDCYKAVKYSGDNLQYVPKQLIDLKICEASFESDFSIGFEYVPDEFKTESMYEQAAIKDGRSLELFEEKWKTYRNCCNAVQQSCYAYEYVPEHLRTVELRLLTTMNAWNGNYINDAIEGIEGVKGIDLYEYAKSITLLPNNINNHEIKQNAEMLVRLKHHHDKYVDQVPQWSWYTDCKCKCKCFNCKKCEGYPNH